MPARGIEADKLAGFLRNGLNTNELSDLCDTLDLAVSGTKADKTERVLATISSWGELAEAMGTRLLRSALDYWEQDHRGTFATLSARAEEFVIAMPAEFLDDAPANGDGSLAWDELEGDDEDEDDGEGDEDEDDEDGDGENGREVDSPEEGLPRLEATRDNVLQMLRTLKLGRVEDERDAQAQMFDALHERFGEVGRERIIGGFTMTSIDFEIAQIYGVEVKHTTSLFRQLRRRARASALSEDGPRQRVRPRAPLHPAPCPAVPHLARQLTISASAPANRFATSHLFHCLGACNAHHRDHADQFLGSSASEVLAGDARQRCRCAK